MIQQWSAESGYGYRAAASTGGNSQIGLPDGVLITVAHDKDHVIGFDDRNPLELGDTPYLETRRLSRFEAEWTAERPGAAR